MKNVQEAEVKPAAAGKPERKGKTGAAPVPKLNATKLAYDLGFRADTRGSRFTDDEVLAAVLRAMGRTLD